jgi:hypothetical protein
MTTSITFYQLFLYNSITLNGRTSWQKSNRLGHRQYLQIGQEVGLWSFRRDLFGFE